MLERATEALGPESLVEQKKLEVPQEERSWTLRHLRCDSRCCCFLEPSGQMKSVLSLLGAFLCKPANLARLKSAQKGMRRRTQTSCIGGYRNTASRGGRSWHISRTGLSYQTAEELHLSEGI